MPLAFSETLRFSLLSERPFIAIMLICVIYVCLMYNFKTANSYSMLQPVSNHETVLMVDAVYGLRL